MDSLLIHQQANDLVQNFGTRNIKKIALHVGMEISETDCFHDLLGLFACTRLMKLCLYSPAPKCKNSAMEKMYF